MRCVIAAVVLREQSGWEVGAVTDNAVASVASVACRESAVSFEVHLNRTQHLSSALRRGALRRFGKSVDVRDRQGLGIDARFTKRRRGRERTRSSGGAVVMRRHPQFNEGCKCDWY